MSLFATLLLGQASAPIPPAPKLPARLSFTDELAGRAAYWAACDATRAATGYNFQCTMTFLRSEKGKLAAPQSAVETLYSAPSNKLALRYEYGPTGKKLVRRALCEGESLLAVRFDEGGKQPMREFSRLSLTAGLNLSQALTVAKLDPLGTSLGAQLFVEAPRAMQTRLWKDSDGSILEVDRLTPRPGKPSRIRRYQFSARHILTTAEEWELSEGRVSYRKEEYRPAPKVAAPFDQTLPDSYIEKPHKLPQSTRELALTSLAPQTAALLASWERAHQRYFTLHATATVATVQQKRTDESRDPRGGGGRSGYNGSYDLWLQRPGSALVEIKGLDGFPVNQRIQARDFELTVEDGDGKKKTSQTREGVQLEQSLRQAALRSGLEPLSWLLDGPPQPVGYDTIEVLPAQALPDGTPVVGLEFLRAASTTDQGRRTTSEIVERVWLGRDFLPRRFETVRKTTLEGLFERDQPPTTVSVVQLSRVTTDREPPF